MTRLSAPRFSVSHHATAVVMALATTLVIFSGVSHLAAPSHAGILLVQATASTSQG